MDEVTKPGAATIRERDATASSLTSSSPDVDERPSRSASGMESTLAPGMGLPSFARISSTRSDRSSVSDAAFPPSTPGPRVERSPDGAGIELTPALSSDSLPSLSDARTAVPDAAVE
jgi:hypothetical protein